MNKYILGNWKLNKTVAQTKTFFKEFKKALKVNKVKIGNNVVAFACPYPSLYMAKFPCGALTLAQDISANNSGAFTSQVSLEMIKQFNNVSGSLVGHSECRSLLNDTDANINKKVVNLLNNNMLCVLCIGESMAEYKAKKTLTVLKNQLVADLKGVDPTKINNLIIAYEPIWAIGTGLTATDDLVDDVCGKIRDILKTIFKTGYEQIPIVYGGSVKSANSGQLLSKKNVNGVLVGGGSLVADEFAKIIGSAK